MKSNNVDDLIVITRAKELSSYIFDISEKAPKKFRFTFISRLQNYSLDILENLIRANFVIINNKTTKEKIYNCFKQRKNYY